jgi:subtilisin family serine protease
MTPLDLVRLPPLMARTSGSPDVTIGLIDGPVVIAHPDLSDARRRDLAAPGASCSIATSAACRHGTFVAGILVARRGSAAPAICPGCTLLARPIFAETGARPGALPSATPDELARAIHECLHAGARILNISAALVAASLAGERALDVALGHAVDRGAIVVVASGNDGMLGGTALTRHPWVIPVAAYDGLGRPVGHSNFGASIGRRGLGAPGEHITSLGTSERPMTLSGTSAAAPFVTGAVALLWSEFPGASAAAVRTAVTQPAPGLRRSVVPPLLDAWQAHQSLHRLLARRRWA